MRLIRPTLRFMPWTCAASLRRRARYPRPASRCNYPQARVSSSRIFPTMKACWRSPRRSTAERVAAGVASEEAAALDTVVAGAADSAEQEAPLEGDVVVPVAAQAAERAEARQ